MIIPPSQFNKKVTKMNTTLKYASDFTTHEKSCNESENEDSSFETKPPKVAFIVFWSSFVVTLTMLAPNMLFT